MTLDGLEADQPTSTEELVERADVAVEGTIIDVVEGPTDNAAYSSEETPIAALVIQISSVLSGDYDADTISVIVPRDPLVSVEDMAKDAPEDPLVIFAVASGVGDYYATFSDLSVVVEDDDEVVTPLDVDASDVVAEGANSLDEVATQVVKVSSSS